MDTEFLKYKFQDGCVGVVTKHRFKIGVRHLQLLYMFICSVVFGVMRGSNGISILAVSDMTRHNDTYIQIHNWDRRIQGTILSSFLFGYGLMLMPAELFLTKFGGKLALTAGLVVNGALSVAMPTIINRGGWVAVCNAQFLLGMSQACLSPAQSSLLTKWLPPNEKGIFSSLIYFGVHLGIIVALPLSGVLAEEPLGWELVFYSQAMMTLSMAALWGFLTAGSPQHHQAVGDAEKEYIEEALSSCHKKSLHKPWRSIIKSPQFWAITSAHVATNAIFIFYLMEVPAYLLAIGIPLRDCAKWSMLPFIAMWMTYVTTAPTIDWISKLAYVNFVINISHFRKLVNAIGVLGAVIGLTVLSNLDGSSRHLVVIVLTGTLASLGIQYSGYLETCKDMSQNYPGTLLMMSSSVASLCGASVPLMTGFILGDDLSDVGRWRAIFLSLGGVVAVCATVYTALGSSERQPWDGVRVTHKFGYHNGTFETNQLELDDLNQSKLLPQKHDNDTAM